jgi:8-oxo-dGTP diphosphatase
VSGRQPCAGAIVHDKDRRILVIRRGQPPSEGSWSIPGGRCLAAESSRDACVREAHEETGLDVVVVRLAGQVERPAPAGGSYLIDDFLCSVTGGHLRAGDDAAQARWVTQAQLLGLDLVPGLYDALEEWGALPD